MRPGAVGPEAGTSEEQRSSLRGIKLRAELVCRAEYDTCTHIHTRARTGTHACNSWHTAFPLLLQEALDGQGHKRSPGPAWEGQHARTHGARPQDESEGHSLTQKARQVLSLVCSHTFRSHLARWEFFPHPYVGKQRLGNGAEGTRAVRGRAHTGSVAPGWREPGHGPLGVP